MHWIVHVHVHVEHDTELTFIIERFRSNASVAHIRTPTKERLGEWMETVPDFEEYEDGSEQKVRKVPR